MASPTNFRVKLNLSKFYKDARKLSFIYVDTTAINNVLQLHSKIANVFAIAKPFYLSTENNIFLPLVEDIRIVQENDIIKVIPGCPGLSIDTSTSDKTLTSSYKVESSKSESRQSEESDNTELDVFDKSIFEKEGDTDVKNVDSPNVIPKKKRKRVRRRKKNENFPEQQSNVITPNNFQQNGLFSISNDIKVNFEKTTPKHLKFNSDDEIVQVTDVKMNGKVISPRKKPTVRSNEATTLSTLLSLKNNPVPVTYSSKRVRTNSEVSHTSHVSNVSRTSHPSVTNNQIKTETSTVSPSPSLSENKINGFIDNDNDFTKVNPLNYPIHESGFEINDVVAFRTLKIGEDYSPTVSKYIIAKVYVKEHGTNDYVFKIIDGHDQIKTPDGKFSLPSENDEDESKVNQFGDELVNLNSFHLVEPRLIYRPN